MMSMENSIHEEMDGEDGGVALHDSESDDIDTQSSGDSSDWTASISTTSDHIEDSGVGSGLDGTTPSTYLHGLPPGFLPGALSVVYSSNGGLPVISGSVASPLPGVHPQALPEGASTSVTEMNVHDESEVFHLSTAIFSGSDIASVSSNGNAHNHFAPYHFFPLDMYNFSCEKFFKLWRRFWLEQRPGYPPISGLADNASKMQRPIKVMDRTGDFQGIEWNHLQTDQDSARLVRRMTVKNITNMIRETRDKALKFGSPGYMANYQTAASPALTASGNFYSFKQTYNKYVAHWTHHQLRHNLCATSKDALFYFNAGLEHLADPATGSITYVRNRTVKCLNTSADTTRVVMDNGSKEISCLSAEHGVLMAGGLKEGTYSMKSLSASSNVKHLAGTVNTAKDGGVNHIHTFLQRRSGLPQSAICANDGYIRVLDCTTNKLVQNFPFQSPVNCSALSPDGRLRIHVSDDQWPVLSDADTGEVLAKLPGHEDHGFACAFSPDGVTFATGHQDGIVQVWDARFLGRVAHSIPAEMSGIRSLAFSPLGSGYPVLVMAEPVDFVSIVDARTFRSKQDIQFFGEVAGFSMPPDDRTLFIGNADPKFGGIMEFERSGAGRSWDDFRLASRKPLDTSDECMPHVSTAFETLHESCGGPSHVEKNLREQRIRALDVDFYQRTRYDWLDEEDLDHDSRVRVSRTQRKTRHLGLREMHI